MEANRISYQVCRQIPIGRCHCSVPVEADSYSTLKDLVRGGHGSTILPRAPIHRELAAGDLCAAPLTNPEPLRRLVLSYPTDRPVARLARFAGQVIAAKVTALVEGGVWPGRLPDAAGDRIPL